MFLGTKTMSLSSVCDMTGIHFMKLRLGSFVMVCIVRAMRWLILVIALMSRILCRLSTYCINTLYSPIISQPPSCTSDQATLPGGLAMTITLLWIQGGGAKTISSSTEARRRSNDSTNILCPLFIFLARIPLASGSESVSSNPHCMTGLLYEEREYCVDGCRFELGSDSTLICTPVSTKSNKF